MAKKEKMNNDNKTVSLGNVVDFLGTLPRDVQVKGLENLTLYNGNKEGHFEVLDDDEAQQVLPQIPPQEAIPAPICDPIDIDPVGPSIDMKPAMQSPSRCPVAKFPVPLPAAPNEDEFKFEETLPWAVQDQLMQERELNHMLAEYTSQLFKAGMTSILEYQTQARAHMAEATTKEMCKIVGIDEMKVF